MLYETRFKWLLPALLFAVWIASACVVQPVQHMPTPAGEAEAQMQATVRALRTQVAAQLQIAPEEVSVIDAEAVEWPDACLGAGSPQEGCALVVTPGYRITLAVNGHEYVYHTDRGPYWLRLVKGPEVNVGAPVITATVTVDNGSCQDAIVGSEGVAFGYCGLALFGGKFVSPARRTTLAEFAARYAPFEAQTEGGVIRFAGDGEQIATRADQEQLAQWVTLLVMEAASGAPMGGLAYHGPAEPGADDASKCATLTMSGGEATVFDCEGNVKTIKLNGGPLSRWLTIQDRFAPFAVETETERLDFTGMGAVEGEIWQQAILAWARTQYAELSSGKVSAAGATVLAWNLGPVDDMEASCMHLTVLAWGEAYAEKRDCVNGDIQDMQIGWLDTAEMEYLHDWTRRHTTLYAEPGYVVGAGDQEAGQEEYAAIELWIVDLWRRIWASGESQAGSISADDLAVCPQPTDDLQLFVDRSAGYCLLYPAEYVAEITGDGVVNLVAGSLMNHIDPRASIEVSDAAGRTLAEIADALAAEYAAGFDVQRAATTVGGEEALVLDNLPGQDINRRVVVLHNGRLYSFFFTPLGETDEARTALESFYQNVIDSFRFLAEGE